ncbi:hypothetical protein Sa4125_12450 [Aureimonas sp. SA4125]|uniref:hypothetical protein n=1 Tax=Aureimonas sp. SA4125 TaxID=2826993 RepID=UPI001CC7C064|nr:hypothetical protein [Aureimonas sp. SA4125]BDA83703.1 hypothetical protein Sa4125_12450 [Aureimonas sp. SA4125]
MTEAKTWYTSKTIWGGLVALGAALAGLFGIDVDVAQGNALALALTDAAAAAGAVLAILGRLDARKTIA